MNNISIFDICGEDFFVPLAESYKKVYEAVGFALLDYSNKYPEMDYDDVIDIIDGIIREMKSEMEINVDSSYIFNFMKIKGWITEKKLNRNGYTVSMTQGFLLCFNSFKHIAEGNEREITTPIFAMHDIISGIDSGNRRKTPYQSILIPLLNQTDALRREMILLTRDINDITKTVAETQSPKDLIKLTNSEYIEKFFPSYFRLMQNGNAIMLLSDISIGILTMETNEDLMEKIVIGYEKEKNKSREEATNDVKEMLSKIYNYIAGNGTESFSHHKNIIDKKITDFVSYLATQVNFIFNETEDKMKYISKYLQIIKSIPEEKWPDIMPPTIPQHYKIATEQSFRNYGNANTGENAIVEIEPEIDQNEIRASILEFHKFGKSKYSTKLVTEFVDKLLGDKNEIAVSPEMLDTKENAILIQEVCRLSTDETFPFTVKHLKKEMVHAKNRSISSFIIARKHKEDWYDDSEMVDYD